MNWQNHTMFRLAIPFVFGMVGAKLFFCHIDVRILLLLCCLALASLFVSLFDKNKQHHPSLFGILAITFSLILGSTLYTIQYRHIEQGFPHKTSLCTGTLAEPPVEKARSWALDIKQPCGTHLIIYIGKSPGDSLTFASLNRGDTIVAQLTHLNPTAAADPDNDKYRTYLLAKGVSATGYAPSRNWSARPRRGTAPMTDRVRGLKQKMHQIYNDHGIEGETGGIIEAMTIGEKANIDKKLRSAYSAAGMSHVLALSGFHIGIIVLMLQILFMHKVFPWRFRILSDMMIIASLWCYALMTGLSASIIRASTMFTIMLLCQALSRPALSLNSCTLALMAMLCVDPLNLNDIGFQLSFISVFGIILLGSPLERLLHTHSLPTAVRWVANIAIISFICSVCTAPLVAFHFGRVPILSVVSNIVLTPLILLLMYGSMLWWLTLWCSPVNGVLTDVLNWTAEEMNQIVSLIAERPWATIEWEPGLMVTALSYLVLLAMAFVAMSIKKTKVEGTHARKH